MRLYGQCCQLDLVVVQAGIFCGTGRAITQIVVVKFRHADSRTCLADKLTCVAGAVDIDLDRAADLRMRWQHMQLSIFCVSSSWQSVI